MLRIHCLNAGEYGDLIYFLIGRSPHLFEFVIMKKNTVTFQVSSLWSNPPIPPQDLCRAFEELLRELVIRASLLGL